MKQDRNTGYPAIKEPVGDHKTFHGDNRQAGAKYHLGQVLRISDVFPVYCFGCKFATHARFWLYVTRFSSSLPPGSYWIPPTIHPHQGSNIALAGFWQMDAPDFVKARFRNR